MIKFENETMYLVCDTQMSVKLLIFNIALIAFDIGIGSTFLTLGSLVGLIQFVIAAVITIFVLCIFKKELEAITRIKEND